MSRIIQITGLTGFVGRNLSGYLQQFPEMTVSGISRTELLPDPVQLSDSLDILIHLAGKAHDLKSQSNWDDYYNANFELTRKLYDAFLQSSAGKFIFISSVKAAADSTEKVLSEDVSPNPQTHYGKSKLLAEEYIRSQPLPEGKSFYILRPCMIHGPGNKGNLNLLFRLVASGIPYPLAAFKNQRSFLSVENLCFIIKEIIQRNDIPGGIYHLADDEALSTNALITLLSQALGKKPRLWKISAEIIKSLAAMGDKLKLPLTSERLHKLTENYVVSNYKIKLALKKPLPLPASEGILKTARAFKHA